MIGVQSDGRCVNSWREATQPCVFTACADRMLHVHLSGLCEEIGCVHSTIGVVPRIAGIPHRWISVRYIDLEDSGVLRMPRAILPVSME
jgi:hypothetical protein